MISLTDSAVKAVHGFLHEDPEQLAGKVLRVFVEGGGCSGLQYGFSFADRQDGDQLLDCDGFQVAVDPGSAPYLEGSVVDFIEGLQGRGFTVQNPNAGSNCGCGKSFNV